MKRLIAVMFLVLFAASAFAAEFDIRTGSKMWIGLLSQNKAVAITFDADGTGDGGSITIPLTGELQGVAVTASCVVALDDTDSIDLMGIVGKSGVAIDSRETFPVAVPVVDGLTVSATSCPANQTNKVVLYVK